MARVEFVRVIVIVVGKGNHVWIGIQSAVTCCTV